jgi:hypothetical protein
VEHERVPESIDLILSDREYEYPIVLDPGWELLGFLQTLGADEFTLQFLFDFETSPGAGLLVKRSPTIDPRPQFGGVGRAQSDALFARLEAYYLGERERETWPGHVESVETWRLDKESRRALKDVLPDGIMGYSVGGAWCEDLCVYRNGELLLGTITHENEAFLRLDRPEVARFEAWAQREEERVSGTPLNEPSD